MSSSEFPLFVAGQPYQFNFLVDQKKSNLPNWSELTKIENAKEIRKIVTGEEPNCLVWKATNKLELYIKKEKMKQFTIENEEIKNISSGCFSYLILTESGKVYSLARSEECGASEIPLSDPEKSTFDEIRPVTFFTENNLFVERIFMGGHSNYFLCDNGQLYGNGDNNLGQLGKGSAIHIQIPTLISENVSRVFVSIQGNHFFFIKNNNKLYASGCNTDGQLGIYNSRNQNIPKEVTGLKFDVSDILDLKLANRSSVIITKSAGKAYSCGHKNHNGDGEESRVSFGEIPTLSNKKIIQIYAGYFCYLVFTWDYQVFGWNFSKRYYLTNQYPNQGRFWTKPLQINLPKYFQKSNLNLILKKYTISNGPHSFFLYPKYNKPLIEDFKILFKSNKFYDSEIIINNSTNQQNKISIPVHKLLLELRTGLKLETIEKIINETQIKQEDFISFLKWIYFDQISTENQKLVEKIFKNLSLSFPPSKNKTLGQDLIKLYKDENSKKFSLLIKKNNIQENQENEKEEDFEEIKVHKLILLARSGLYRALFEFTTDKNINKIQDYSGKSKESLQILIKYFYTDKIELIGNENQDIDLTIEELSDSIEYYQLNEDSFFVEKLMKLKK
ncbi:btk-binding protein-related [Anaeramoeba flamelloides]|uniref:Btk-binding protein-related n=1 Tax=Anaeramoeba flamelloides TaxID=1746091 RepID=A0ABQ8XRJ7_9EUKA|nr:btk-binding protein-related [Anaeramoeba flamelloides]